MPEYTSPFVSGFGQGQSIWSNMQAMKAAKQAREQQAGLYDETIKQKQFENAPSAMSMRSMGLPGVSPMGPSASGEPMGAPEHDAILPNRVVIPFQEKLMMQNQQREQNQANRQLINDQKAQQQGIGYENQFRDEFNQQSKTFQSVIPMYKNIVAAATNPNPTAQSDMSLIFAYMKILDPTSTVREGEYATAQNAGSIPDSVRNQFNRLVDGQKLQPDQRINFAKAAQLKFKGDAESQQGTMIRYTDLAKRNRVNPENVVYDYAQGLGGESFEAPNTQIQGFDAKAELDRVRQRRGNATQR